jgi:RimJ/RimL family protein N-acetyltransferase
MIETARLILRAWRDEDRQPFAAMSADPAVMAGLGGVRLSRREADAYIDESLDRLKALGFCRWAVKRREDGAFLGSVGAAPIPEGFPLPRGVEIGWRLARHAWGFGYATEAARAAIDHWFAVAGQGAMLAFTSPPNLRSQAVMGRLGLARTSELDFDHPALAADHPQRRHLVWKAERQV